MGFMTVPQENCFDTPWPREWYNENLHKISRFFGGTNIFNGWDLMGFMMVQSRRCDVPQEDCFDAPWLREWHSENLRKI